MSDQQLQNFDQAMPEAVKPSGSPSVPPRRPPLKKVILWGAVALVLLVTSVQLIYAEKYDALVQVIGENRVGVNPTGDRLDFGDLPRGKGATRAVTLSSGGTQSSYIAVWTFGDISELMKVNRNYFTLTGGKSQKLEFTVYIPASAELRYYRGKVWILKVPKLW